MQVCIAPGDSYASTWHGCAHDQHRPSHAARVSCESPPGAGAEAEAAVRRGAKVWGRRLRHLVEPLRMLLVLCGETDQRIPLVALQHPSRSHLRVSRLLQPRQWASAGAAAIRTRSKWDVPWSVKPKREMDAPHLAERVDRLAPEPTLLLRHQVEADSARHRGGTVPHGIP